MTAAANSPLAPVERKEVSAELVLRLAPGDHDSAAAASALGLNELCHDLQQEVTVMEHLVSRLIGARDPQPLEQALRNQVEVLRATLREARLPSPPCDLALRPLVVDVVRTARLVHPGVIDLHVPDEGLVRGVASDVRRAIVNLLDNARLAAPQGSIRVTVADDHDEVLLEVEDDGSGTARAFNGSGLGMAVVADVARRHNGTVTRRVGPLGGLAVGLHLPRTAG